MSHASANMNITATRALVESNPAAERHDLVRELH
jgi:hypothetical protein